MTMNIYEFVEAARQQLPAAFSMSDATPWPDDSSGIVEYELGSVISDKDSVFGEETAEELEIEELVEVLREKGTEALALYISFHEPLPDGKWGIFFIGEAMWRLREKIRQELGLRHSISPSIQQADSYAVDMVLSHERYHFWIDLYTTQQELTASLPFYIPYSHDVYSKVRLTPDCYEESLANLTTVLHARAISRPDSRLIGPYHAEWYGYVTSFCDNQPPGYCDWGRPKDQMKRRLGGQLHFGVQSRDLEEPQALWVALHPKDAGLRCPKYLIKKTPSSHNGLALTITVGGHNWRLHRSDPDIWPSVPHAIDNEYAEKLNPFTGEVYNVRNRQYLRRLHGRDLDIVQERVRIKWPDVRI